MAIAPDGQRRRLRGVELLQPAPPPPVSALRACLDHLRQSWDRDGNLAGLWQDWPTIAGERLAPHCRPLSFERGILTVGAQHPQWRQALLYTKPQLLSALRQAGHAVRDLRIQQHHSLQARSDAQEATIWARHPSRADVHGMGLCPRCGRPAPNGEIDLWSCCGFCHRRSFTET